MAYQGVFDRRLPYSKDGTIVKAVTSADGTVRSYSTSELDELNDNNYSAPWNPNDYTGKQVYLVFFFESAVSITGIFGTITRSTGNTKFGILDVEGSNDTTNGIDGSWTSATASSGYNGATQDFDSWRKSFEQISIAGGPYVAIRVSYTSTSNQFRGHNICHLYGATATPTAEADFPILFLDPDDSDNEFTTVYDFGDIPSGTTSQKTFKVKNNHASLTANNLLLSVVDPNDYIRISVSSGGPWNTSENIVSLAAGVSSSTYYIKSEPPAPPTALQPESGYINATVGSFT